MISCSRITGKEEDTNVSADMAVEEGVVENKEEQHNLVRIEVEATVTLTEIVLISEAIAIHQDLTIKTKIRS